LWLETGGRGETDYYFGKYHSPLKDKYLYFNYCAIATFPQQGIRVREKVLNYCALIARQ
jgi:hypothetical protein